MKALLGVLSLVLIATIQPVVAMPIETTCTISGVLTSDTTWSPAICDPYVVGGNVRVDEGVTLTIRPGTTVRFQQGFGLEVEGTLIARGLPTAMITLTSNQMTPGPNDWNGLEFTDASVDAILDDSDAYVRGSALQYVVIEYATSPYFPGAALRLSQSAPFIDHCIIRNNGSGGLYATVDGGELYLRNNLFSGNAHVGIDASHSSALTPSSPGGIYVARNTFTQNNTGVRAPFTALRVQSGWAAIDGNIITENSNDIGGVEGIVVDVEQGIISNNVIADNVGTSILADGVSNTGPLTITGNLITANHIPGDADLLRGRGSIEIRVPQQVHISANQIAANTKGSPPLPANLAAIFGAQYLEVPLDVTNNFWGTTDTQAIEASIWHYADDSALPEIRYAPFRSKPLPIPTAGPAPSLIAADLAAAPGSVVAVGGSGFPAGSMINLSVYGEAIGALQADSAGSFGFNLATESIGPGRYEISATASSGSGAMTSLLLDSAAPLRQQEFPARVFVLPVDAAPSPTPTPLPSSTPLPTRTPQPTVAPDPSPSIAPTETTISAGVGPVAVAPTPAPTSSAGGIAEAEATSATAGGRWQPAALLPWSYWGLLGLLGLLWLVEVTLNRRRIAASLRTVFRSGASHLQQIKLGGDQANLEKQLAQVTADLGRTTWEQQVIHPTLIATFEQLATSFQQRTRLQADLAALDAQITHAHETQSQVKADYARQIKAAQEQQKATTGQLNQIRVLAQASAKQFSRIRGEQQRVAAEIQATRARLNTLAASMAADRAAQESTLNGVIAALEQQQATLAAQLQDSEVESARLHEAQAPIMAEVTASEHQIARLQEEQRQALQPIEARRAELQQRQRETNDAVSATLREIESGFARLGVQVAQARPVSAALDPGYAQLDLLQQQLRERSNQHDLLRARQASADRSAPRTVALLAVGLLGTIGVGLMTARNADRLLAATQRPSVTLPEGAMSAPTAMSLPPATATPVPVISDGVYQSTIYPYGFVVIEGGQLTFIIGNHEGVIVQPATYEVLDSRSIKLSWVDDSQPSEIHFEADRDHIELQLDQETTRYQRITMPDQATISQTIVGKWKPEDTGVLLFPSAIGFQDDGTFVMFDPIFDLPAGTGPCRFEARMVLRCGPLSSTVTDYSGQDEIWLIVLQLEDNAMTLSSHGVMPGEGFQDSFVRLSTSVQP